MSTIARNTYKVAALPATLEANSIYYTKGAADELNVTVVDQTGTNSFTTMSAGDINSIIDARQTAHSDIHFVADMAALTAHELHDHDEVILVQDASAHADVDSGTGLFYVHVDVTDPENITATYTLISTYDSISVEWTSIIGAPAATAAQIDAAVAASHEHGATLADIDTVTNGLIGNVTVLAGISVDANGDAVQNGKVLAASYYAGTPAW